MTHLELNSFIEEKKVKFTEPQKKVINQLLRGSKLTVVNKHYLGGGSYAWMHDGDEEPSYAGSVYKSFWNAERTIKKQTGIDINFGEFFTVKTNFVGNF